MERAKEAGKLAEGKLLYEVVLNSDKVTFPFESSELTDDSKEALDAVAQQLKADNKNVYVEIQGHTDSSGPESDNLALGERRAEAVRRYLNMEHGIPLHRMSVISYGETAPVTDNDSQGEPRSEPPRFPRRADVAGLQPDPVPTMLAQESRESEPKKGGDHERTNQAVSPLAVALVLSTAWLYGGCGGDVTADLLGGPRTSRSRTRTSEARRGADREASFIDRLLGDRTREVTVPPGTVVQLRFSETVSSRYSSPGDPFRTTVEEDIRVADAVAIPSRLGGGRSGHRGASAAAGRRPRPAVAEFNALELPSGRVVSRSTPCSPPRQEREPRGRGDHRRVDIGGVVLGEAVDEGEGGAESRGAGCSTQS